jgi:hypothetical protein
VKTWPRNQPPPTPQALMRAMREQGVSFGAIAAALNRLGIPGASGGRWFPATVRRTLLSEFETKELLCLD